MDKIQNVEALISLCIFMVTGIVWIISKFRNYWASNERKSILGTWYSINLTIKNKKNEVVCYEWQFYIHWAKFVLMAKGKSMIDQHVNYFGKVYLKGGYIYLEATGEHAIEKIMIILKPEFPIEETKKMKGVGIGLTFANNIATRSTLFQRDKIDLRELDKYKTFLKINTY